MELWKWLRLQWDRVFGCAFVVTGAVALLTGWARENHVDLTGLEVGSPSLEDAYLALTSEEGVLNHG